MKYGLMITVGEEDPKLVKIFDYVDPVCSDCGQGFVLKLAACADGSIKYWEKTR